MTSSATSIKKFYDNITTKTPLYGADVKGSIIADTDSHSWNLNHLDTVLT